jgi:hypothetical protein
VNQQDFSHNGGQDHDLAMASHFLHHVNMPRVMRYEKHGSVRVHAFSLL